MQIVLPPAEPVFRVSRNLDPFTASPWQYAARRVDTAGGRFDDPRVADGLPLDDCFRIIYCATQRAGAFGETIAHMRHHLSLLAALGDVDDDEPLDAVLDGLFDSAHPGQGVVPIDWRLQRRVGSTFLDPALRFVDIAAPETLQVLRRALAPVAVALGIDDVDLSSIAGPQRRFTQECARYVFEQTDDTDLPAYAGIRYVSRLNLNWECWAIFDSRFQHTPLPSESIHPHDPGLMDAARVFGLSIEGVRSGQFFTP